LKDYVAKEREFNGSVVPSSHSSLIATILDEVNFELYSIDCDLMVRVWSLDAGRSLRSYMLETRDSQIKALNSGVEDNVSGGLAASNGLAKKAQLAHADDMLKFLVVCFEGGEIQINNLYTGALVYNNYSGEALKLEYEVAKLSFFRAQTKYWIAASCYDGKVAFLTKPVVAQGRSRAPGLQHGRSIRLAPPCKCSHHGHVLSLDINQDN